MSRRDWVELVGWSLWLAGFAFFLLATWYQR